MNWVLPTNGIEWQLYHVAFDQDSGISHDLVFELNFMEKLKTDADFAWDTLSVLAKSNVQEHSLETYYERNKLLSPNAIVNTLVSEEVLTKIRQKLNRQAPARLDIKDVFRAVMQVLNREVSRGSRRHLAAREEEKTPPAPPH
jgi:hypothetical protein